MNGTLQIFMTLKSFQSYSRLLRPICTSARRSDKISDSAQDSHSQIQSSNTLEESQGTTARNQNVTEPFKSSAAHDDTQHSTERSALTGFLNAYLKQEELIRQQASKKEDANISEPDETFASLLRKSEFINLGDPVGKIVLGEIINVVGDDLYIDFGWKFYAVCPKSGIETKKFNYKIGNQVLLKIKDLELTASFLGENYYTSLNEADCSIVYSPTMSVPDPTATEIKLEDALDALED